MQDPTGREKQNAQPRWTYPTLYGCKRKQTNPQIDPSAGEKARVDSGGCRLPRANETTIIIIIVPSHCAGSQTPRSPSRPLSRRVHPTTPSRRWARADAPRKRRGGVLRVGRPCCPTLTSTQEEMQDAREQT